MAVVVAEPEPQLFSKPNPSFNSFSMSDLNQRTDYQLMTYLKMK